MTTNDGIKNDPAKKAATSRRREVLRATAGG